MAKRKHKGKATKSRSFEAFNALGRRPAVFKDRRQPRKQARNWRRDTTED